MLKEVKTHDPVCGEIIFFNDSKEVSIFKSSEYSFCDYNCIDTFENNPSAYADKDGEENFIFFEDSNSPVYEQIKINSNLSATINNL